MQPLFAVHNNVSLLSVTIAPSTFLAALTLVFVFLSLYLPRLPSLPRLFSFGRRRTDNISDKDVVLQRQQQRITGEFREGYGNFLDVQQWRNRENITVDWRHRQLPPLPPPPFRPLLQERGYVEAEYHKEEEKPASFRKKPSSRSDRERRREQKREDENPFRLLRRGRKSSKPSTPSKEKHRSRGSGARSTATPADLVPYSSGYDREGVSGLLDLSSDDSRDREERSRRDSQLLLELETKGDASSWFASGVVGRFASWVQSGEQSAADTNENKHPPQMLGLRSTNTNYLETDNEGIESMDDSISPGGYSPPAWRRLENGDRSSGFWRKSDNILGSPTQTTPMRLTYEQLQHQQQLHDQQTLPHPSVPSHIFTSQLQRHFQRRKERRPDRMFASRSSSPGFDSEEDALVDEVLGPEDDNVFDTYGTDRGYVDDSILERAMRTRLPGSMSPDKERSPELEQVFPSPESRMEGMRLKAMASIQEETMGMMGEDSLRQDASENYIRFPVHSQAHRTGFVYSTMAIARGKLHYMTRSWTHIVVSIAVGILSFAAMRTLSHSAVSRPVPDLVKVAGVARSFEPLIYYSENGVAQVHDLEATGVAVWDLGESVRLSNLTSAPIIVQELDELSNTLKTLAMELTRFFANIDGDIDGILIVMDWARRELSRLQQPPASSSPSLFLMMKPLTTIYDSVYSLLACAGLLENAATGSPTAVGTVATTLFGMSGPQRTHATLHRTFHEFLVVLEEAVVTELQHSLALFALFENVDRQFLNLVRTVAREASVQDERHADLLSSLWTRILGPSAAATAKYEHNRELLRDVREKTVRSKGVLVEHNHRLLALKTSLESLRRKLVSPLVRSVNSSTLTLDEQIQGLEDVGGYLADVRSRQKGKLMEALYGVGSLRERIGWSGSNDANNDETVNAHYREATRVP